MSVGMKEVSTAPSLPPTPICLCLAFYFSLARQLVRLPGPQSAGMTLQGQLLFYHICTKPHFPSKLSRLELATNQLVLSDFPQNKAIIINCGFKQPVIGSLDCMFKGFLGSGSIMVVSDRQREQMTRIAFYNITPTISALYKLCIACEFSVHTEYSICSKSIQQSTENKVLHLTMQCT